MPIMKRFGFLLLALLACSLSHADSIAIDTITYRNGNAGQHPSWTVGIGNGSSAANKCLFVMCHWNNSSMTISSVTVGGSSNAFTHIGARVDGGNTITEDLWYYVSPPTGNQTVQVNYSGSPTGEICESIDLTGVNQSTPWESSGTINNQGSQASVTLVASTANDWLLDSWGMSTTGNPTGTNGQTVNVDPTLIGGAPTGFSYAGPESVGNYIDSYSFSSVTMDAMAVLIVPAPAPGTPPKSGFIFIN